ncbi:NAD-dependent protein deacetylase [Micropruina sonneratiae]|uniref:NAD-dependent protein deacetylase n=1 Tax=Micropruina sonneratiae TaxID=2986940 RepID=UPI0022266220|nr:NAD-dependent protein deacetylase [Micropruina sp. KQZ13P-5]MCW3156564.1 NAD-dependent protein deacetylase [Micropruina sp. KQZ13P-5]
MSIERLADLLRGRRFVALTGAGMSTDSGIPDYRGAGARPTSPIQYDDFVRSEQVRRRYWARSLLGFRSFGRALPNPGHRALAALAGRGLSTVITQNVDGLHGAGGSRDVLELHGRIDRVICLGCAEVSSRTDLQRRLEAANPGLEGEVAAGRAELDDARLRPDGDAVVENWDDFVVLPCERCGGVLKPDVVFFGESVPRGRVADAYAQVDAAEALLVAGSSLTVMSGLRFVRHAAKAGTPVAIVNRGATRGDDLALLRLDAGCSETLSDLVNAL